MTDLERFWSSPLAVGVQRVVAGRQQCGLTRSRDIGSARGSVPSSVGVAGRAEFRPDQVGQGHRDQTRGEWGCRPGRGPEHEPAVEASVVEDPQFQLLAGQTFAVGVPAPVVPGNGALLLQTGRPSDEGAVLEAAATQPEQSHELPTHMVDHDVRAGGGLGQPGGVVDLCQVVVVGEGDHLQFPGPGCDGPAREG
ncbi:hypothetical protein [Streptomyces atratus]|uniref:hypothetical protein n=1 Tax=Streptomyces TaxID=1883 RepID=UPI00378AAD0B